MLKHLIIGTGNLGEDLHSALEARKEHSVIIGRKGSSLPGRSFTFNGTDGVSDTKAWGDVGLTIDDLASMKPEVIWCTVGAGGPTKDTAQVIAQMQAHLLLPLRLAKAFENTETKLIFFSSHYLNNDPEGRLSEYSMSKAFMERALEKYDHCRVLRVGSLYGVRYPMKSLPGKTLRLLSGLRGLHKALNLVTPTPTEWLAEELVRNRFWEFFSVIEPVSSIGPIGSVPVSQWMMMIAEELGKQTGNDYSNAFRGESFIEDYYPADCSSGSLLFNAYWEDLWEKYGPGVVTAALKEFQST